VAAKVSDEQWEEAKALYKAGKSLRDIEKETGIPRPTIDRKAKKEGWTKDELRQLVVDMTRDKVTFETLNETEQKVVSKIVTEDASREIKFKSMRDKIAEKAFMRIDNELDFCEVQHIKPLIEAADKTCVMAEIAPRFNPTATTFNNLNAQQTNVERTGENGFELLFTDANHVKPA
jgi:hypothetical protein